MYRLVAESSDALCCETGGGSWSRSYSLALGLGSRSDLKRPSSAQRVNGRRQQLLDRGRRERLQN